MNKLPFLFGIHCHQPVDNFNNVVDEAVEKSYKPFIETALKFENFKFSVHFSGWLLEYIKTNHHNVFLNLQRLTENNQIEFFSGGFYEPILSAIPSEDRCAQIIKLNNYIKNHFGTYPKGLWLTERVWDSSIIPDIVNCGIEYVIVDDYHFISAGFDKSDLYGYYITEQDGYKLKIFPIDKNLRYMTPFRHVEELEKYFSDIKNHADLAMVFDDGEKFGIWPGTYEWVYTEKWLQSFINAISNNDLVEFSHFYTVAENIKPKGIAYLPVTSYIEMGEWSLFADKSEQFSKLQNFIKNSEFSNQAEYFVKGGIWKNFFTKYPESNRIHKRYLNLSKKINEFENQGRKIKKEIKDDLYKSQCNDVLWHGIFGGLYLPNLRNNAYKYLIKAEKELDEIQTHNFPSIETIDYDFDGYNELFVRNKKYNAVFSSINCGQMISFDIKDLNFNFLNTLARHTEKYHFHMLNHCETEQNQGIKTIHETNMNIDEKAKELIINDWYLRNSFIDHFVCEFNCDNFFKMKFNEMGDFVNNPAEIIKSNANILKFSRKGGVFSDKKFDSQLHKTFNVKTNGFEFDIMFETEYNEKLYYVLEMNFHFYDLNNIIINGKEQENNKCVKGKYFTLEDNCLKSKIGLEFEKNMNLYSFLVSTTSQSEKGVDFTAQSICVLIPVEFQNSITLKGKLIFENI